MAERDANRLFNPDPRRHYRRRYSITEVRIGLVILASLGGVAGWVAWMGTHPDPELYAFNDSLLDPGAPEAPPRARTVGPVRPLVAAAKDPVPAGLAAAGWHEASRSEFDASNLYEKINGRASYYESFGFERMHYVSIERTDDPEQVVDVEIYDLGRTENALGAWSGERQPDAKPKVASGGLYHLARNALFMVRGRFYVRAIGSDESEAVRAALANLRGALETGLAAEALPWAYALFGGSLGIDVSGIAYHPQNAFSFGFASGVYSAALDDDGAQMFTVAAADGEAAERLARQFADGFGDLGEAVGEIDGVSWSKDRYLGSFSGVARRGALVIGVHRVADRGAAEAALARLAGAVDALSAGAAPPARAEAPPPIEDSYPSEDMER